MPSDEMPASKVNGRYHSIRVGGSHMKQNKQKKKASIKGWLFIPVAAMGVMILISGFVSVASLQCKPGGEHDRGHLSGGY